VQLGNIFFDGEQYPQAITWYEQALALTPGDVNVSTDLGVAYYYTNQPDRALAQFDRSLAVDSKHIKTLLNIGIVRAFGKQDLAGAGKAWQQVVDLAPNSPEGLAAKKGPRGHQERAGRRCEVRVLARFLLLLALFVVIARTFWRFIDAVVRGASGPTPQGGRRPAGHRRR
jgi:tetratricopeptide (TPR) repeat protein